MKFISTEHKVPASTFFDALMHGLAPDGGLYVPETFPRLTESVLAHLPEYHLHHLGQHLLAPFLPEIPPDKLQSMIVNALSFPIPLISLAKRLYLLEVFHGPTLSFKDVGARFMAQALVYFMQQQNKPLLVLVATSGDTGSAIANALHNMPHVFVYVLYPSQKITRLQEQQMTTLGGNIHALEVQGTFDDCQRLVKTALLDEDIRQQYLLTTANSINISRLLPQMIYHSFGVTQLQQLEHHAIPNLCVPSGNLGNVTAAIYAKAVGIPMQHFIVANNNNAVFTRYLDTGKFTPHPSEATCSNAMDVGNPSNFARIFDFYHQDLQQMQNDLSSIAINDAETIAEIRDTYQTTGYILDPHTAVGVAAAKRYYSAGQEENACIVTSTAHPAKFPEVIKKALDFDIPLPTSLQQTLEKPKDSTMITTDYAAFKALVLK